MKYYSIIIDNGNSSIYPQIDEILEVKSNYPEAGWGLEIVEDELDDSINPILYLLSILENKYQLLENIGVSREYITIWILYEYENQCNIELTPEELKSISNSGISLCISCWEKE